MLLLLLLSFFPRLTTGRTVDPPIPLPVARFDAGGRPRSLLVLCQFRITIREAFLF